MPVAENPSYEDIYNQIAWLGECPTALKDAAFQLAELNLKTCVWPLKVAYVADNLELNVFLKHRLVDKDYWFDLSIYMDYTSKPLTTDFLIEYRSADQSVTFDEVAWPLNKLFDPALIDLISTPIQTEA